MANSHQRGFNFFYTSTPIKKIMKKCTITTNFQIRLSMLIFKDLVSQSRFGTMKSGGGSKSILEQANKPIE